MADVPATVADELGDYTPAQGARLVKRGLVWATRYREDGETRCGTIIAASRADATALMFQRGLLEVVEGRMTALTVGEATTSRSPGEARGGSANAPA